MVAPSTWVGTAYPLVLVAETKVPVTRYYDSGKYIYIYIICA